MEVALSEAPEAGTKREGVVESDIQTRGLIFPRIYCQLIWKKLYTI